MVMSLRKALLAGAALVLSAGLASAQSAKIGTFDPNKILTGSKLGQKLQDEMNQYRVSQEAQIKKQKEDYDKLAGQYKSSADTMSEERREQMENDLLAKRRDLERTIKDAETELGRRRQKAVREMEEQVAKVLTDFGRNNGYTLILQADLCAYSLPSIDISDELVRLVDSNAAATGTAPRTTSAPATRPATRTP